MGVNVDNKVQLIAVGRVVFLQHVHRGRHRRMCVERNVVPVAVYVVPQTVHAVVAEENSIGVHHWQDFEDDVLAQQLGDGMVGDGEELDEALHDVRRWRLHRVAARHHDNHSDRILAGFDGFRFLDVVESDQLETALLHAVDE